MTPRALVALLFLSTAARAAPLDAAGMKALLEQIDERQRNAGDYKALVYLEQKEKGETDIVREALVYRRDADDKLLILFTALLFLSVAARAAPLDAAGMKALLEQID